MRDSKMVRPEVEPEVRPPYGRDDCPFSDTINDLDKAVFKGNGQEALVVRMGNLETKINTATKLILAQAVIIPVLLLLFQWGAKAIGLLPAGATLPASSISATMKAKPK